MNGKIEYGLPQVYLFEIDSNGDINKQSGLSVISVNYDSLILQLNGNINITTINQPVVLHQLSENNFGYGKMISNNQIELDYDYCGNFDTGMEVVLYSGVGMALFDKIEISVSSSGQSYKGKDLFDKEWKETDVDINVNVQNSIYSEDFLTFVNNFQNSQFGQGVSFLMSDYDVKTGKQIKPRDVALLAFRRTTKNDGYEEFFINRVNMAKTSIPNLRDSFSAYDVDFPAMLKSLSEQDCISYSIETSFIDFNWEDEVDWLWEDEVDWLWEIGYYYKDN